MALQVTTAILHHVTSKSNVSGIAMVTTWLKSDSAHSKRIGTAPFIHVCGLRKCHAQWTYAQHNRMEADERAWEIVEGIGNVPVASLFRNVVNRGKFIIKVSGV